MWIGVNASSEDYLRRRRDPFFGSTWIFFVQRCTLGWIRVTRLLPFAPPSILSQAKNIKTRGHGSE
ncbi:uncharacterized protein FFB20_07876 [Fusarium fujikuroi]|nr:uncharacterized protein FFB20_07876 [Fusarium fujikuroi]SCN88117.1 uncharacterized protein FFC1_05379 [Fusarium fujikuroi]SCN92789.1 uncharacterized protein FFE2_07473 [Fusarium fujikuroi]SCO42359.1 uncharacterized protein FFNC_08475 [Fusarium fujikuroi]SCV32307.1 uncharacterized protein FFFS_03232 [Fusarium fujikuroi]